MCFSNGTVTPTDAGSAANLLLGTNALGSTLGFIGGLQDARTQRRIARNAVNQNAKNATNAMLAKVEALGTQAMQRRVGSALVLKSAKSAADKARATNAVRLAESGSSSVDVEREITRVESESATNILIENKWAEGQLQQGIENAHQEAANQIDGFRPPPIAEPSPIGAMMGFMKSYFDVMSSLPVVDPGTLPTVGSAFSPGAVISGTMSGMESLFDTSFGLDRLSSYSTMFPFGNTGVRYGGLLY
jgi:hypothetical protein